MNRTHSLSTRTNLLYLVAQEVTSLFFMPLQPIGARTTLNLCLPAFKFNTDSLWPPFFAYRLLLVCKVFAHVVIERQTNMHTNKQSCIGTQFSENNFSLWLVEKQHTPMFRLHFISCHIMIQQGNISTHCIIATLVTIIT